MLAVQDKFKKEDLYWKNNKEVKEYKEKPFAPMNVHNTNQLTN